MNKNDDFDNLPMVRAAWRALFWVYLTLVVAAAAKLIYAIVRYR